MVNYPKDWEENKLGNLAFIKTGNKNNEDKVSGGKYPFYVRSEKVERINTFSYDTEAILVPGEGNIGSVFHYVNGKFDVHQRVYAITNFRDTLNAKYLYWFMVKNFGSYALSQTSKATVDSLRLPAFKNFCVVIPPFPEQKAIADALTAFDTHINNLAKLIEKKKMIRDGAVEDLVTGKRRLEGFSGNWEECELNKLADIFDGTHQTPKYTLTGVPFVSVENITNLYKTDKFINERDFELEFKNIPEKGDILMTRIGDIGTASIVTRKSKLAYYVSLALFKHIKIYSEFLLYYIHSSAFQKELFDRSLNFAIPKKINKGEIGKCNVHFPTDIVEQQAIADILTAMDKEIADLEEEKEKYIALKAGAMDDLLTGKIRLV